MQIPQPIHKLALIHRCVLVCMHEESVHILLIFLPLPDLFLPLLLLLVLLPDLARILLQLLTYIYIEFKLEPTPLLIANQTALCMSKLPQLAEIGK